MAKLQIGDIVFQYSYGKLVSKNKVSHVTKTQAVINRYGVEPDNPKDGTRLRREYSNKANNLRAVGAQPYSPYTYYLSNPEHEEKFQKALYIQVLGKFKLEDLTLGELQAIFKRHKYGGTLIYKAEEDKSQSKKDPK